MRTKVTAATIAALALGALTVSSAFATPGEWDFASEAEHIFITSEQESQHVLTFNAGTIKCDEVNFTGAVTGMKGKTTNGEEDWMAHTLKVHPSYGGCTVFGQKGTFTTTGCDYTITPTSTTTGAFAIDCETGKSMTLKLNAAGCVITIPAQTPANNLLEFTEFSEGTERDVLVTWTVGPEKVEAGKENGITYTSTGGLCGAGGKNGKYRGSLTASGYSDAGHETQAGIWIAETGA